MIPAWKFLLNDDLELGLPWLIVNGRDKDIWQFVYRSGNFYREFTARDDIEKLSVGLRKINPIFKFDQSHIGFFQGSDYRVGAADRLSLEEAIVFKLQCVGEFVGIEGFVEVKI